MGGTLKIQYIGRNFTIEKNLRIRPTDQFYFRNSTDQFLISKRHLTSVINYPTKRVLLLIYTFIFLNTLLTYFNAIATLRIFGEIVDIISIRIRMREANFQF